MSRALLVESKAGVVHWEPATESRTVVDHHRFEAFVSIR